MIGIFSFDGPMYCDINGVYCNTTVTRNMLNRYLVVVDKLYVVIRTIHINKTYQDAHLQVVETDDKVKIVEMPNLNMPLTFLRKKFYQDKVNQLVSSADLFFLRIPSIISNMVGTSCRKLGKPYFAEVGGCAWDSYYNHGLLGKLIAPYMYFHQKMVVKCAAYTSYVTETWLQNRYPTNGYSIVASNVYLKSFDEGNIRNRIYRYTSSDGARFRIGTIASVDVRYKGQEYVIKALGILKKEGIILDYDLVGAGNPVFLKKLADKYKVSEDRKSVV